MIRPLTYDDLTYLPAWLAKLNGQDQHFIAWLPSHPQDIHEQLHILLGLNSPFAWVYEQNNHVEGFFGILPFFEQNICRLLGPFSTADKSALVIEQLWHEALPTLRTFDIAKIACYRKNEAIVSFCEANGFNCYNTEKTLTKTSTENLVPFNVQHIVPYQDKFKIEIANLHPQGAFYTLNELLIAQTENGHDLFCYQIDGKVVGYLYTELITGANEVEICFVNVLPTFQGRGIGSSLILHAVNEALTINKVRRVAINVRQNNESAEKLYKRLGFKEDTTIYAYQKIFNNHR